MPGRIENQPDESLWTLHYAKVLESEIQTAVERYVPKSSDEIVVDDSRTVSIDAGSVFPRSIVRTTGLEISSLDRAFRETARLITNSQLQVIDAAGHSRPVYRPLLLYCLTQTLNLHRGRLEMGALHRYQGVIGQCCDAISPASSGLEPAVPLSANRGAEWAEFGWRTLARGAVSNPSERTTQDDSACPATMFFKELVRARQPTGLFLATSSSDNPETTWYHELLLLHAVGSWAAITGDRELLDAARQTAAHHQEEIQLDHATNHPWALFAFLLDSATFPTADAMLHAAATQSGDLGPSPITLMLMADALYCLRLQYRRTALHPGPESRPP